jgi:hypothetical protein
MTSTGPSAEAQGYLESLMHAGQDAMKQFDHALVSAVGVGTKDSFSSSRHFFPFTLIADLQREYFKQLWRYAPREGLDSDRWRRGYFLRPQDQGQSAAGPMHLAVRHRLSDDLSHRVCYVAH